MDVLRLWDIGIDNLGGIVKDFRVHQKTLIVLEECGIVVAVNDPLIQNEFDIDVLALNHGTIFLDFVGAPLAAKATEDRQITEIVQMMNDWRNTERAH